MRFDYIFCLVQSVYVIAISNGIVFNENTRNYFKPDRTYKQPEMRLKTAQPKQVKATIDPDFIQAGFHSSNDAKER